MADRRISRWGALAAWAMACGVTASGAKGCRAREGCLSGDDGSCKPAAACVRLRFPACGDGQLELGVLGDASGRGTGLDSLGTRGDIVLANDRVRLVLDAIDAPHYLAPTGGNVIDFTPTKSTSRSGDSLNVAFHAVGILPRDAVAYRALELEDARPDHVAVIVRGTLDGRAEITVVTRYELRACEPGVRVRTELFHGGRDLETFFLADAFYWGGREVAPFTPLRGRGFVHPELDLAKLGEAFATEPFLIAHPANDDEAAYALIPCDRPELEAFHSNTVTASGSPRTVLLPGDGIAYERFFAVAEGPGASRATDIAFSARSSQFGESSVVVSGRVVSPVGSAAFGEQRAAEIMFYEPAPSGDVDAPSGRRPWNIVVPDPDGNFRVRLPARRAMRAEVRVLGRPLPEHVSVETGEADMTMPNLVVPPSGVLDVVVTDGAGAPALAEIVLTPVAEPDAWRGSLFGAFDVEHCTPWLGPPHGGSPGCNRALVGQDGAASFAVPTGTFWVYATRGPFATLARKRVDIRPGERTAIALVVDRLPGLLPDGVLSADFHVHGGASFDSSLPDRDRARTFIAEDVQVIAATDHDVVTTYAQALRELHLQEQVVVLPGVETTGQILFYKPPGAGDIPRVIGHFNFWPLHFDANLPRNGAPWDERLEPGALYDRVTPLMEGRGVIQLNHPYAETSFGRDEGFLAAIGYDPRRIIGADPPKDTPEGQLTKRAPGGHSALDYDVQEVMNGTSTRQMNEYRAGWFSFLSQGILRAGTANSDSHTLAIEVLGYPRNLVFGGHDLAHFDRERFNSDVRAGHMIGTNGPVVLASIEGRGPSLSPMSPSTDASLDLEVRAAPWIPVEEIRVIVNGSVARTLAGGAIARPSDPFGRDGIVRFKGSLKLSELLAQVAPDEDAWIVVEAGLPLWPAADLDDDGRVDTTDNNHDGVIDQRDHDGLPEDRWYQEPKRPAESEARFHAAIIADLHWSAAFTNPLLIDRRGDGWKAPHR